MDNFTYAEVLQILELVIKEEHSIQKKIQPDIFRNALKIFRPGLFRKLSTLIEIDRKLNVLGALLLEEEEKQMKGER